MIRVIVILNWFVLFQVFVIYDFFTDDEIDDLWDASPTLSRGVMVTDDEKMRFSETRSGAYPTPVYHSILEPSFRRRLMERINNSSWGYLLIIDQLRLVKVEEKFFH